LNLLILATAWGPKHGGINSFNLDFAVALAKVLGNKHKLFCVVLDASPEESRRASEEGVNLVNLDEDPSSNRYDESWAYKIQDELKKKHKIEKIDHWIGHDAVTGKAAVKGSKLTGGKSSLIMHMNYGAYQGFKGENGQAAKEKEDEQRDLFAKADYLFANGPLLASALKDLVGRPAVELVPGFADILSRPPTGHFLALTFGRMDSESRRIKQGALAVAAFGSAVKEIRDRTDASGPLNDDVRMAVAGITEPGGQDEVDFKKLLEERAGRAIEIHVTKFEEDRERHFSQIGRASFAMMLSWHEGFGLTGWEAIAAEVPLIVGKNTGLFKLLENTLTRSIASAWVEVIDVKGKSSADDESNSFTEQDEQDVRDSIKRIAANLDDKQAAAKELKRSLVKKLGCTWEDTARTFLKSIGHEVRGPLQPSASANEASESTAANQPTSTNSKTDEPSVIAIPTDSWPTQLKDQIPDCLLLRPENRVVRFHSFRTDLRDEIVDWVTTMPEKPIRLRLDAGEGGAGKTRLMIEVCIECAETHGWTTGFLQSGQDIARELPKLLSKNKPTLIVIDYAETRASEIAKIVKSALAVSSTERLRLLLLSRDGRDWWNRLAENSTDNQAAAAIMRDASTKQGPYYLQQRELNTDQRSIAFQEALNDFAARKQEAVPEIATPDLSAPHFGQPIYVHMAALQRLRGENVLGQNDLLETTLGHEKAYWRKSLEAAGMSEDRQMLQLELTLAAITLIGGCPTLKDARELLERTPLICDATGDEKRKTLDVLASFYSSNLQLSSLQPDILGEVLVDQVLDRDSSLLDTVFDKEAKPEHAEAAMTVLARMARRNSKTGRWLEAVLENYLPNRIPEAIAVAQETGGPIADLMGKAVEKAEGAHKKKLLQKYREALPQKSENLSEFSVTLHGARLENLKLLKGKRTPKQNRLVVDVCSDLAQSLRENGMLREAVGPARIALKIAQQVFTKNTPIDRNNLAMSLGNLANHLNDVGEFREALEKARQSEEIRRELARTQPDAYNADWAMSLGNLADSTLQQSDYRVEEVLRLTERAYSIFSDLSQIAPKAYLKWEAFVMRSFAEAELARGDLSTALEYSRLSSQKWSEVHLICPGLEMTKTILSTHTLIRCELANKSLEHADIALVRWISENANYVQNGGAPAKTALQKMASSVLSDMGQTSFEKFPENVRKFGELETLRS